MTVLGVTCQAWSAQSPHQHNSFTPETHPTKGLEGNVSLNEFIYELAWAIRGQMDFCSLLISTSSLHHSELQKPRQRCERTMVLHC